MRAQRAVSSMARCVSITQHGRIQSCSLILRQRDHACILGEVHTEVRPHRLALRVLVTKATRMASAIMGRPVYGTRNLNASDQKFASH